MHYEESQTIEARYIRFLGPEFGKVYFELVHEHTWLRDKWREYRALFAGSEARIELLNRAAPRFFGQLDGILWEDVLLHLCRLTDPPKVSGHHQLTIQRLPGLHPSPEIRTLADSAVAAAAFARDWRNRHIGHRSLARAVDPAARPLAHASRASVEEALGALDELLNAIHEKFFGGGISFDVPGGPGDVNDLVGVLDDGVRMREAREERFRTGKLLPEDMIRRGSA